MNEVDDGTLVPWMVFFSTHPPLERRIAALEAAQ